ncbi:NurA domain [Chlamydia abortus]|nr:NurA domain [Chlamydia abortus]
MNSKYIPESAIDLVAQHINERSNKPYPIPVVGTKNNPETPQVFEIVPFDQIDVSDRRFYAIDGSYNSQQFYNGLAIGIYTAGYICYHKGKQIRVNDLDEPLILGQSYYPQNILFTKDEHFEAMYEEVLELKPVKKLIDFFGDSPEEIFAFKKDIVCSSLSTLLSFCQELLEWSLVLEIAELEGTKSGDFILRDGTLRSNQIKQRYLVKLGRYIHERNIILVSVTKNSPIKMELSYCYKQIDSYLQDQLKPKYPFKVQDPKKQKLCCWFEVPDAVLMNAYGGNRTNNMYAKKDIIGGRGFGLFTSARLDYVEKLQNYDWLIVDVNIFDAIPAIENKDFTRDVEKLQSIFFELTRLTQEHYILGYPFPLVEVHNFVTLKKDFKDEIIKRAKLSLYQEQRMDNIEIENLFLDIHDKF